LESIDISNAPAMQDIRGIPAPTRYAAAAVAMQARVLPLRHVIASEEKQEQIATSTVDAEDTALARLTTLAFVIQVTILMLLPRSVSLHAMDKLVRTAMDQAS
jgi:hypothetical protein